MVGTAHRWAVLCAGALVLAGVVTIPAASAVADPGKVSGECTIVGTSGPDRLRGTTGDDVICGLGGDDVIVGRGGDDLLRGGGGDDTIVGGPGDDLLGGGRGNDDLDAHDAVSFRDGLRCGRGRDSAVADVPDVVTRSCESVAQDHAPSDVALASAAVAENQPAGTFVGTLSTADADAGDTHAYTLVAGAGSGGNGSFAVSGDALRTAVPLDHETTPTLSVRVRSTDSSGAECRGGVHGHGERRSTTRRWRSMTPRR